MKKILQTKKGFALLFTMIVITLVMAIAVGISNLTLKQTLLSSTAKDSQAAFYQADAGVECGMYYDVTDNKGNNFAQGTSLGDTAYTIPGAILQCGSIQLLLDVASSGTDHFVFKPAGVPPKNACFQLTFDKTTTSAYYVESRGMNVCDSNNPRQVERALKITY